MNNRVQMLLAALCILLIVIIMGSACGEVVPEEGEYSYLTGDFAVNGTILTDEQQEIETTIKVSIAFRVVTDQEGELTMSLAMLNLLAGNVSTGMGDSGLIGLALVVPEYETPYDPSTGRITTQFSSTLHYELIDRIEGYQQLGPEGEDGLFLSFTEVMVGNLTGELPRNLQIMGDGNETDFEGGVELSINPDYTVLGSVRKIRFSFFEPTVWRLTGCQVLRIKPVFIGTGPTDPDRTGIVFDDLMANATKIWDRCGTVRCLKFEVLNATYLNKPEYKIIESSLEAQNLAAEVNATDALEIFVVQNLTIYECDWGGGITYSRGTESAKIVSCDSQLSVACPCPCTRCRWEPCECGALNYYHLAHELGHVLNLLHPEDSILSTATSIMEWSGWCNDNPDIQSARNCRNAKNPLLRVYLCWAQSCSGSPDIND